MINRDDVIDLLKLAAVFDQRTVGEEDVQAWLLVGQRGRWTKPLAQRVLVDHYGADASRPRISPAQITDSIGKLRSQAAATFEAPVIPDPPPDDYPRWYRRHLGDHVDQLVTAWADGQPIPVSAPATPGEISNPTARRAIETLADSTRLPGDHR